MGVHGWELLDPHPQTLVGTVVKDVFNGGVPDGDGDWSLFVSPAPGFDHLLTNPRKGRRNINGQVECEVEPSVDTASDRDSESALERQLFQPLVGKTVTVWGPWVADCSHSWNDDSCLFGCCDVGKTEIHPIFSIRVDHEPDAPARKLVEIFVFSDASTSILPPNAGQNITAQFSIAFPTPPAHATRPTFHLSQVTDLAASATFDIVATAGTPSLQATIQSGEVSAGKGFYHAFIALHFHSASLRESLDGRGDLSQGLRSLHPLFDAPTVSVRAVLENLE